MSLRNREIIENIISRDSQEFPPDCITSFVTSTVMNFEEVFSISDNYYNILMNSLIFVIEKYKAKLVAYVFMPNHIHLIIEIKSMKELSSLMRDFKKYTSTKIRQRLEKEDKTEIISHLKFNAHGIKNQIFKLWMDRFDDVYLYSEEIFFTKFNYIHMNPVKKGLVENPADWKYSSYRNYYCNDQSVIFIDTNL